MTASGNIDAPLCSASLQLAEAASNPPLDGQDSRSELPVRVGLEAPSLVIRIPVPVRAALTAFNTREEEKRKDMAPHETDNGACLPSSSKRPHKQGEVILHHRSKSVPRVRPPPPDLLNYIPTKMLSSSHKPPPLFPSTLPPHVSAPLRTPSRLSQRAPTSDEEMRRHRSKSLTSLPPNDLRVFDASSSLPPVVVTAEDVTAPPSILSSPRPTLRSLPITEVPVKEETPLPEIKRPTDLHPHDLEKTIWAHHLTFRKRSDVYATTMITFANPLRNRFPGQVWAHLSGRRIMAFQRLIKDIPHRSRRACERNYDPKHCRECLRDTLRKNLLSARAHRRRNSLFPDEGYLHCRECVCGRDCRNERPKPQTPPADSDAMNVDLSDSLLFDVDLLDSPVLRDSDSFSDDEDDENTAYPTCPPGLRSPVSGADSPIIRDRDEFSDEDDSSDDEAMTYGNGDDMDVVVG